MKVFVYFVCKRPDDIVTRIIVLKEYSNVKILVYLVSKRSGKVIARIIVL